MLRVDLGEMNEQNKTHQVNAEDWGFGKNKET
jgi:hypothetical protein